MMILHVFAAICIMVAQEDINAIKRTYSYLTELFALSYKTFLFTISKIRIVVS